MAVIALAGGLFAILLIALLWISSRFKRCPSDRILVVYGRVGGEGESAKCLHGGGTMVWPIVQGYSFLDLTPIPIEIKLHGALSQQNIRVNTPATFTVGVSTEPGVMQNAAERLLGLDLLEIENLARDIIFGQMRVVIATMPIEQINTDREQLITNITDSLELELRKVGLRLINVNIQDITDESGYIDALGREAAARAISEAKVKVAEQERDGDIGGTGGLQDGRRPVAVERNVGIGEVVHDEHLVATGEVHHPLHEVQVHTRRGRVVRERQDDDPRFGPRVLPALLQHHVEVVADRERDLAHLRSGEQRREEVYGVRGRRHQNRVSGLQQHPHQVRQPLLGTDRVDDLRLGVQLHTETSQVEVGHGPAELGDTTAERVAMVAGISRGLGQLLHGNVGRRQVGVAEPQVDNVLPAAATLHLEPIDDREDVRGQVGDAPELHRSQITE